jgi:inward rectifier potassium channel
MNTRNVIDPGFGTSGVGSRSMNKDGTFNVKRIGDPVFRPFEVYHTLIRMSWLKFFLFLFSCYFTANLIFASIYYFIGAEQLSINVSGLTEFEKYMEVFFFSSQTLTTLGYGRVAPIGLNANVVAAIESMTGLVGFAWATGLTYGRFSKPQSKIRYSENALISPYREIKGLMFRIVNKRRNQLIEVEADVTVGYNIPESGKRGFVKLELERSQINLFPSNWTIVHPISSESIFFNKSESDLRAMNLEIYVMIKAFDDTFAQTIYSRTSYTAAEIVFGAKFINMTELANDGSSVLFLERINEFRTEELNS